jgi:serine/threonine-protein kinase RsbW
VAVIRRVARGSLHPLGVTEDCTSDILLALSEACTNVVLHAAATHEYEVRLEIDGLDCSIAVVDAGHTFDVDDLRPALPADDADHGRGIAIMQAVMDHTDFVSQPEDGTVVRLRKQLVLKDDSPLHHGLT